MDRPPNFGGPNFMRNEKMTYTRLPSKSCASVSSAALLLLFSLVFPTIGAAAYTELFPAFHFDKPYKDSLYKHYSVNTDERGFFHGAETFWVSRSDKPFLRGSKTNPRCEKSVDLFWKSGTYTFDGYLMAKRTSVKGTLNHDFIAMQIFGARGKQYGNTALSLRVYDGANGRIKAYGSWSKAQVVATNIYDKWIHVRVIHDATRHRIKVFINDILKIDGPDNGPPNSSTRKAYYFKYGVYQDDTATDTTSSIWNYVSFYKGKPTACTKCQ
jgi:hypothetical protein